MSSVEGNENIEETFNKILQEEYKQQWELISVPKKLMAFFCYTLPALLLLGVGDYHNQNVLVILFFSAIIGTGCYSYLRHQTAMKSFFSNDRPLSQVIQEVKSQKNDSFSLSEEEESDWSLIVAKLEKSMETEDDSDNMTLSTLFDRSEPTVLPTKRASWLSRFFGRK